MEKHGELLRDFWTPVKKVVETFSSRQSRGVPQTCVHRDLESFGRTCGRFPFVLWTGLQKGCQEILGRAFAALPTAHRISFLKGPEKGLKDVLGNSDTVLNDFEKGGCGGDIIY